MAEDSGVQKDKDNKPGNAGGQEAQGRGRGSGQRNRPPRSEGGPPRERAASPAPEGGATPAEGHPTASAGGASGPRPGDRREGRGRDDRGGDRGGERGGDRGGERGRGPRDDRRGPPRDDRRGGGRDDRRSDSASPLTASLFSAMQDKQVPCRISGCQNTWTWFAAQQIRGFGQPPPDRMCDEHLAQFNELADREVPCRTPGCPNTWLWKRGAQLAELQRTGKLRRPARLCAECFNAERETHDQELPCKLDGCRRTWTWTRDAQLRHRMWVLRQRAKAARPERPERLERPDAEARPSEAIAEAPVGEAPVGDAPVSEAPVSEAAEVAAVDAPVQAEAVPTDMPEGTGPAAGEDHDERRKRRRRRRRGAKVVSPEGPPERMCGLCAAKLSRVQAKELPCKVHGCTRSWTWDRASQMRAWVQSGSDDVDYDAPAPKRMCEVCREFCRTHPDREVACGRPGCATTWTYKTGAQLQAFLAGRTQDPLKLCGECAKGEFAASFRPSGDAVPEGAEIMPCVVPGCDGTWVYIPGMKLRDTPYGELSTDRMCGKCRRERGLDGGDAPVEVTAADLEPDAADELHAHDHDHDHDEEDDADEAEAELVNPQVADAAEDVDPQSTDAVEDVDPQVSDAAEDVVDPQVSDAAEADDPQGEAGR